MNRKLQEVLGYLVGALIVWFLVPGGIFLISRPLDELLGLGPLLGPTARLAATVVLLSAGLSLGLWSVLEQRARGQGGPVQIGRLDISPRTRRLVVTGPYRYSRNPMLFGAFLAYLGYAAWLDSLVAAAIVLGLTIFMLVFVVPSEERRLARDFGEDYEAYRRRTPRFLPRPPRQAPPRDRG